MACNCSRREFIKLSIGMSAGTAIAQRFGLPLLAQGSDTKAKIATAKRCVMLWMMGAPSQIDTWDPKPGTETGGPFSAIDTSAPGIQICEHLPFTAKQMKNVSLIRTVNSRDPNHDTAQYLLHTAYRKSADVEHPHLGAVIANELGEVVPDLPMGVVIGGAPPAGAGYLRPETGPIVFDKISAPAEDVLASPNNPKERLERRWKMLERFGEDFDKAHEDRRIEARKQAYEKAYKVLTSERVKAFDVRRESDEVRAAYGDSDFGNACLMARRLLEAGVRFVEVMYGDWDTHNDNFNRTKTNLKETDRPMAALLSELHQKGMLKDTLFLWMGEFGRTPRVNASQGRDHWTTWSVALAGGGVQGGRVIGETDEMGMEIKQRPVSVNDLYATIYHAFGIETEKKLVTVPRPMKVVDGGKPVLELF